jgi:hypothetical protein
MALNTKTAIASVNLGLNAAFDVLNGGFIEIYDGSQPASPDVAVSTQNKLAKMALNATAFGAASAGTKTANAIANGVGLVQGTATWFRAFKSDDTTAVVDGTAGTSATNMVLVAAVIAVGDVVSVTAWTVSQAQ